VCWMSGLEPEFGLWNFPSTCEYPLVVFSLADSCTLSRFPNAKVIGNDLSPIQPIYVYPNVRFEVDDVELEWPHPPNYFDLIHIRCMSGFIRDWDFLLKQAFL
jgi:hypothetical protein